MLIHINLVGVLEVVSPTRILVDIGSAKTISRWRPCKRVLVDDDLVSALDLQ